MRKVIIICGLFLSLSLAVLIIGSCATTSKTQEAKEAVNQDVFFQSVRNCDIAEVKRLIKVWADVNAQSKNGSKALMMASWDGHVDIIKLLIKGGAFIDTYDNKGHTALMYASHQGHAEVAGLLIEKGACFNVQDKCGTSTLMYTSHQGHAEVVKLLSR